MSYDEVIRIRLGLMYRLQLIESRFAAGKIELGRLLHQTELSVDVVLLLAVAQSVPARKVIGQLLSFFNDLNNPSRWIGSASHTKPGASPWSCKQKMRYTQDP